MDDIEILCTDWDIDWPVTYKLKLNKDDYASYDLSLRCDTTFITGYNKFNWTTFKYDIEKDLSARGCRDDQVSKFITWCVKNNLPFTIRTNNNTYTYVKTLKDILDKVKLEDR